ncbi:hypothetical protein [Pseudoduganella armeniaca]|jgi:hypothetical protein|uniref:Lipoprotein n=1 Tax=Pseudoduganella armeniaca TaxID=2072590 RepID=A0A2R4C9V8_9BURK|nr:hypothetical protein [Pseudoduganella armeniaca]AVR96385.1 hypothetical protein C9I28_12225 [Pseudoduganella armeniaca]
MKRLVIVTAALLLAACGEVDQSKQGAGVERGDHAAYTGAHGTIAAKGWEAGSRSSWQQQIRNRGQLQNEYNRIAR